jgi:voltage-gated potassium channel
MSPQGQTQTGANWRKRLWVIIFEADTPAGKTFDVALLVTIIASIAVVMMESVDFIADDFGPWLYYAEWIFTAFFTIEYVLRLVCVERPLAYARSFFGVVDVLAVIPTYLSLLIPGAQSLLIIRSLRLLRIFRIFKLGRFLGEADVLMSALRTSRHKIIVFLGTVLILLTIFGSAMYLIEGGENGFTSIPRSIYWAVVTMTTVGYGDIAPQTIPGQILASAVMILGYSILAVPTGIVTAEIVDAVVRGPITTRGCPECMTMGHLNDANYCKDCGAGLHANDSESEEASPPEQG